MQSNHRFTSPLVPATWRAASWSFYGQCSARHDTGQSRKITWRGRGKRGKKERGAGEGGGRGGEGIEGRRERMREGERGGGGGQEERKVETKKRRNRLVRVPRGEVLGLACPGMASSPLFSLRGQRSSSSTSHLRVLNLPSKMPWSV